MYRTLLSLFHDEVFRYVRQFTFCPHLSLCTMEPNNEQNETLASLFKTTVLGLHYFRINRTSDI
jgi:hypothetical protein